MRISGGIFRGRKLQTTPGLSTRPTTDKIRQAIFNILMHDIENADVLDLFAGSGALGIEAVSRGAKMAVFVESGKDQINVIEQNLKALALELSVIPTDFYDACDFLAKSKKQFDLIFADPPYEKITPQTVVDTVNQYSLLSNNGLLIIEHKFGQPVDTKLMKVLKKRKFGQTEITILCKK